MKLIIDIPEEEYNDCKMQVELIKQEGFLVESLNTALKIHVANGKPLEEELHREKEQAYYCGYEDGRKSEWTAVAERTGAERLTGGKENEEGGKLT